jgi:hypothetical protein
LQIHRILSSGLQALLIGKERIIETIGKGIIKESAVKTENYSRPLFEAQESLIAKTNAPFTA